METIAALTLLGGHDLGTVLELAMEAVCTGRVSPLRLRFKHLEGEKKHPGNVPAKNVFYVDTVMLTNGEGGPR